MLRAGLARAALAAAALLATLAAIEIALRIAGYDPLGEHFRGSRLLLAPSERPDLDFVLAPGSEGVAWGTRVRVNSLGFRGPEVSRQKPPDVRRIALLGDSVAFGAGVAEGEELSARLAARLADGPPRTEVLDLAIPGLDTLSEVAFLEEVGLPLSPDVVVVVYCINDAGVQSLNATLIRLLHERGALLRHLRLAQLVLGRVDRAMLRREARVANEDAEFRRRYAGRIAPLDDDAEQRARIAGLRAALAGGPPVSRFLPWYASEPRIGRLRFALARLRALADAHRFEVMVVLVPYLDEGGRPELFARARDIVAHEARRQGFDVLDLHPRFAAAGLETLQSRDAGRPDPLHPNAAGHALMAESLAEALR